MGETYYPPQHHSYEVRLAGFLIRVQEVSSILSRSPSAEFIENGIAHIPVDFAWRTYGAGFCVDGMTIDQEFEPYIFHLSPDQFHLKIPVIDFAHGGLIAGGVEDFCEHHANVRTASFVIIPGFPVNIAVERPNTAALNVYYSSGM